MILFLLEYNFCTRKRPQTVEINTNDTDTNLMSVEKLRMLKILLKTGLLPIYFLTTICDDSSLNTIPWRWHSIKLYIKYRYITRDSRKDPRGYRDFWKNPLDINFCQKEFQIVEINTNDTDTNLVRSKRKENFIRNYSLP